MSNPHIKWTSDVQKVLEGQAKMIAALQKQVAALRKVDQAGRRASKSVKAVTSNALGFINLAAVIATATRALTEFDAEAKRVAAGFQGTEVTRQRLAQIATSPGHMEQMLRAATLVSITEGFKAAGSQDFIFQGLSADFTLEQLIPLARIRDIVPNVTDMLRTVQKIQTQFGASAGTPFEILNQVIAASRLSPLGFGEVGPGAARAAAAFKSLGGDPEELFGAVAFAARGDEPREAITGVRQFATFLSKDPRYAGLGFLGASRKFRERFIRPDGTLDEIAIQASITEERARRGASLVIPNLDKIAAMIGDVREGRAATGTAQSPIQKALFIADTDPGLAIQRQARIGKALEEQSSELEAMRETAEQAMLAKARARLRLSLESGEIGKVQFMARRALLTAFDFANLDLVTSAGQIAGIATEKGFFTGSGTAELSDAELADRDAFARQLVDLVTAYEQAKRKFSEIRDILLNPPSRAALPGPPGATTRRTPRSVNRASQPSRVEFPFVDPVNAESFPFLPETGQAPAEDKPGLFDFPGTAMLEGQRQTNELLAGISAKLDENTAIVASEPMG